MALLSPRVIPLGSIVKNVKWAFTAPKMFGDQTHALVSSADAIPLEVLEVV